MYFALVCGLPGQTLLVALVAPPGQTIRPGRGHTTCVTLKRTAIHVPNRNKIPFNGDPLPIAP